MKRKSYNYKILFKLFIIKFALIKIFKFIVNVKFKVKTDMQMFYIVLIVLKYIYIILIIYLLITYFITIKFYHFLFTELKLVNKILCSFKLKQS